MSFLFQKLRLPERARGADPGPVTPRAWNSMVDYLEGLEKRVAALVPNDSADIGYRTTTSGGFTAWIKRRKSSGGVATETAPWEPTFFTEGSGESLTYKCRFNFGTFNQVPAGNWNDAFTLPDDEGVFKYVILTVATASGKVTGITLSVDSSAPTSDQIAKNTPPVSFKVVLGAIGRADAKMIVTSNLQSTAAEVFRESVPAPDTGAEPFARWWRWNVSNA